MFFDLNKGNIGFLLVYLLSSFICVAIKNKSKRVIFLLFLITSLFLLNRTLVILSFISILIFSKPKWQTYSISIVAFLFFLWQTKVSSNIGRLFILRNSFSLIKNHPFGIGLGNFKRDYLLQQAMYFKLNGINSKEAMLADNTQYALNEYVQYVVELGVIPFFLLLIVAFIFLFYTFKRYRNSKNTILLASCIGVLQILISAITYFTLHNWYIIALLICFVLFAYFQLFRIQKLIVYILVPTTLFTTVGLQHYYNFKEEETIKDAQSLSIAGYKSFADSLFKKTEIKNQDEYFLMAYSDHQFRFGNVDSAIYFMNKSTQTFSQNEQYFLLGDYHLFKGNDYLAEYYYTTAFYMVPNRFTSRLRLADFYKHIGNTIKEKYWLEAIRDFPEKIPSTSTKRIKEEANRSLKEL